MRGLVTITALALLCITVFLSTAAYAQENTSRVYLKNGDTITGTIIEQQNDILKIQTSYGVIEIKTEDINEITFGKTGEEYKEDQRIIDSDDTLVTLFSVDFDT